MNSSFLRLFTIGAAVVTAVCSVQGQVYLGNGGSGFGGPVGGGTLSLSDDGTTLTGTITRGTGNFNDQLVIYIDSVAGGFGDTSQFADGGDGLRQSISGINFNATSRSLMTFPAGFQADYALSLGPSSDNFGGLWTLAAGGNNSLVFNSNANLTPTGNSAATSFTFSITLASIGVAPGTGFRFITSYMNRDYRSNESFGNTMPAGTADPNGNIGPNAVSVPDFATYGTPVIPEPTTVAFVLAGLGGLMVLRRRK